MRPAWVLCVVALGCGDDDGPSGGPRDSGVDDTAAEVCGEPMPASCAPTAAPTMPVIGGGGPQCNPVTQSGCAAGEKCTWIQDATQPSSVGHIGCAPNGTVVAGCACTRGAVGSTGYDDCVAGTFCHTGICKPLCDHYGSTPTCDALHACAVFAEYFSTGDTTPAAAGLCVRACNPLADNDFLGSGQRGGCACAATDGCYGSPSAGTPPVTAFTCSKELSSTLVHRSTVTGTRFVNACAQGYLPLLYEQTGSTTIICVALCKPMNCFAGNCGTNNENRLGAAPHRCTTTDRRGVFDNNPGGEHCAFLWRLEYDYATSTLLPSQHSDAVGYCFDHSKYLYDSNMDGSGDTPLPACADVPDGFGGSATVEAADLGCVDSTRVMSAPLPRGVTPAVDIRTLHD